MKKLFTRIIWALGVMTLLMIISVFVSSFVYLSVQKKVPQNTVLTFDFERNIPEYNQHNALSGFLPEKELELKEIIDALESAGDDPNVKGFFGKIGPGKIGLAQIQELRDAILRFQSKGKFTIAFSETFGEMSPGNGAYYLATAFDKIYLQPSGDVGLTGLNYDSLFLRGALDKLGVIPRMDHRYEYKNAMNTFTDTAFDAPFREAMQSLMESQFSQIVSGCAMGRKMDEMHFRELVDAGPYMGTEVMETGLIDKLLYRDEVKDEIENRLGTEGNYLKLSDYYSRRKVSNSGGDTIALIYGTGGVQRGESSFDPMSGKMTMGSDEVVRAFRSAIEDEKVKGILFRVDSPGGSYVASDAIWRETVLAGKAGKPIVVSMGNVAGSGGYFVAMAADKIIAEPGTITGSIGVFGGKMLTRDFWKKLGITWDNVATSKHATLWSNLHDYSPEEWEKFQGWLDRVYTDFTGKVAQGRHLPLEKVQELAKGRVWTGEQALELGLVDKLGGMNTAVETLKEILNIPVDQKVNLVHYPPRKNPIAYFLESDHQLISLNPKMEQLIRNLYKLAGELGLSSHYGVLEMPFVPAEL